jgi:hypothetical protein
MVHGAVLEHVINGRKQATHGIAKGQFTTPSAASSGLGLRSVFLKIGELQLKLFKERAGRIVQTSDGTRSLAIVDFSRARVWSRIDPHPGRVRIDLIQRL